MPATPRPLLQDERSRLARFDDWALGLSAGMLAWICLYFLYYLFSAAWTGGLDHVQRLKWITGLFIAYRGSLFLIDVARRRGAVLTRMPVLAFVDLFLLGILVVESWDDELHALLAPLFLVFLALVPILYRNVRGRVLHVAFSIGLMVEAVILLIPQPLAWQAERNREYRAHLEVLQRSIDRLPVLPPRPASQPPLMKVVLETSWALLEEAVTLARQVDATSAEVEGACGSAEVFARAARVNVEVAVRDYVTHHKELTGGLLYVAEMLRKVKALEEDKLRDFAFGELEAALRARIEAMRGRLAHAENQLQDALLQLEKLYYTRLADGRRVLVESYSLWLNIVLGFLVQFQIRRFVNKRIETERSRTFSEMLSERHRMDAQNWINLTAGLTHNIGNEVRGYDVFLEEILLWLDEAGVAAPAHVREKLLFIYHTNQARLGFIQFLREFALLKQVFEDARPVPGGLRPIDLGEAIRAAHARVRTIETSYNPADSTDPGDTRKRRKFLGTPLELQWGDGAPVTLRSGREAVLDFFFYELIKNALRHCSGRRPLVVTVRRVAPMKMVELCFINDLLAEESPPGRCTTCGQGGAAGARFVMPVHGKEPLCEQCLHKRVENTLLECFHPGRGSGTGLGLFVIKHFLEEYYYGHIHSGVEAWRPAELTFMVYFRLVIPDNLGVAIEERNSMWSSAP